MRFTIRDIIWLTVLVAMACTLMASRRECTRLKADQVSLKKWIEGQERISSTVLSAHRQELRAFKDEMQRISGKRLKKWRATESDLMPGEWDYTFEYADDSAPSVRALPADESTPKS
jgi:hypothetical protein